MMSVITAFLLGFVCFGLVVFFLKNYLFKQIIDFVEDARKLKKASEISLKNLNECISEAKEVKFYMMCQKDELNEFSEEIEVKFRKITESLAKAFEMRHYYENEIIKLKKIIERKEKKERENDSN